MTTDKLNIIIAQKNEQLELQAINRASRIIDEIAKQQLTIAESQKNIAELRAELVGLQIQQINPVSILG